MTGYLCDWVECKCGIPKLGLHGH